MLGHKSFNLKLTQLNEFLIANKRKATHFASGANKQNVFRCLPQFAGNGISIRENPFPQFQLYKHGIDAVAQGKTTDFGMRW